MIQLMLTSLTPRGQFSQLSTNKLSRSAACHKARRDKALNNASFRARNQIRKRLRRICDTDPERENDQCNDGSNESDIMVLSPETCQNFEASFTAPSHTSSGSRSSGSRRKMSPSPSLTDGSDDTGKRSIQPSSCKSASHRSIDNAGSSNSSAVRNATSQMTFVTVAQVHEPNDTPTDSPRSNGRLSPRQLQQGTRQLEHQGVGSPRGRNTSIANARN